MTDSKYVDNYADVSNYALTDEREATLLDKQTECNFMWTNAKAEPLGVIMNYVFHDGKIWVTATRQRKRIAAIEARPRVAVSISSRGTDIGISQAITFKGIAIIHDDPETNAWMNKALAKKVRPHSAEQAAAFEQHLANSEGRVAIEIVLDKKISFDSDALFKDSPTGPSRSMLG